MATKKKILNLGAWRTIHGKPGGPNLRLPADHLVTHAAIFGMTGSGKTGLVTVLAEEALRAHIPTLIIDVKGDLPNLLLTFPNFNPEHYHPWVQADQEGHATPPETTSAAGAGPEATPSAVSAQAACTAQTQTTQTTQATQTAAVHEAVSRQAAELVEQRRAALARWDIGEAELAKFVSQTHVRVLTPGATSGEPLHMLSPLEQRSARWDNDLESARSALSAAVSLVLRLLGRDPDPARSKEHVLLSVLAERRLLAGQNAELPALMQDVISPPVDHIGALPVDSFMKKAERLRLSAALNTLLASPTFGTWRQGAALDVQAWLTPQAGRTPAVILSVAHLDDEERTLVLGLVLEEVLSWVRTLPGSQRLKALVLFDEVYGFLPPHPANPATKRPIVALMKQARAFGVGVVVATQNPMDVDYRALSNAGLWCIGRLQTDADRARVLDGLRASETAESPGSAELGRTLQRLSDRWFVIQNAHVNAGPLLLQPRYALSWMRGPMTRPELRRARGVRPASAS